MGIYWKWVPLACPPTTSLVHSLGGCCGGLGWVLMGTRAVGTEGLVGVRWAMFPEEGEKQVARLEEGSSVSHGLRERKKEVWGEKRRRQEEEKALEGQVSWCYFPAVSTPELNPPGKWHCLENRGVNEEKPNSCSHPEPPAPWHVVVSLSWKIQMAVCKPKCMPGSWLSTDQSVPSRGRSTEEQLVSQRKYFIFSLTSTRKYESSQNCKKNVKYSPGVNALQSSE